MSDTYDENSWMSDGRFRDEVQFAVQKAMAPEPRPDLNREITEFHKRSRAEGRPAYRDDFTPEEKERIASEMKKWSGDQDAIMAIAIREGIPTTYTQT